MRRALLEAGLSVRAEMPIQVRFRGEVIGTFRADLVVNDSVLVELKTCEALIAEHASQTLNYLKATALEVALLMNFGQQPRFKRLAMDNETKRSAQKGIDPHRLS